MKKLISILTAFALTAAVISGCSLSGDGKTKSVGEVEKVPVSQIWDGYESLQGQDYGVIKLPERIEKPNVDKYYALEFIPQSGDMQTASRRFFKAFFGDKYDESRCKEDKWTGHINYDDPKVGFSAFIHAQDNESCVGPAPTAYYEGLEGGFETVATYDVGRDDDVKLELVGGTCTVGELTESVYDFMREALYPLYDAPNLPMKPYRVDYQQSMTVPGVRTATVWCVYFYDGLSVASEASDEFEKTVFAGYEVEKYYTSCALWLTLEGVGQIDSLNTTCLPFDAKGEELDELVSLSKAVELLRGELAEHSRYEFDKVYLSYCVKTVVPSSFGADPELDSAAMEAIDRELDPIDKKLVPNWCFEWTGYDVNGAHNCYIKVNAVTGEITIDANPRLSGPQQKPYENSERLIEAEILGYENDELTYRYNGETFTQKMFPELFTNDVAFGDIERLSRMIIANDLGRTVKGVIRFRSDGGISWCNVAAANGSSFWSSKLAEDAWLEANDYEPEGELEHLDSLFDMKRVSGSVYEFTNKYCSFTADLNYLDFVQKGDFGDHIKNVEVSGYQFDTGEIIVDRISVLDHIEEQKVMVNGMEKTEYTYYNVAAADNADNIAFFGKIQSLRADRAVVLLNDGKTTCDVPTYFNDGELREGMAVAVSLKDVSTSFFGSGKQYKAEYAVFLTHPEEFIGNYDKLDHYEIAYAVFKESRLRLSCTMIKDAG